MDAPQEEQPANDNDNGNGSGDCGEEPLSGSAFLKFQGVGWGCELLVWDGLTLNGVPAVMEQAVPEWQVWCGVVCPSSL